MKAQKTISHLQKIEMHNENERKIMVAEGIATSILMDFLNDFYPEDNDMEKKVKFFIRNYRMNFIADKIK